MIPVILLTALAYVPIAAIIIGVYYFLLWFIPKEMAYDSEEETRNVIVAHIILLLIIWLGWSIFYFCEGKDTYIKNHPEITQVQE